MKELRHISGLVLGVAIGCLMARTVWGEEVSSEVSPFRRSQVMDRVILAVMEDYYDPDRMAPLNMFKGALEGIEKNVAEFRVLYSENNEALVSIVEREIALPLEKVRSPWGLSRAFKKVFAFIEDNLKRETRLEYRDIEYAAINGLLATLDPHTSAMTPEVWNELRMSTVGEFEGIGIRITTDYRPPCDGDLTVVDVFKGTPAERVGMMPGDKIVRIGKESTVNITTTEAAKQLRGTPGTTVDVWVQRPGGVRKKLSIVRQRIPIESVNWKMLDDQIGYVELQAFQQTSAKEMHDAMEALSRKEMKGMILDLRGNPGGLLDAAIEIADMFVSSGTLVATAGRDPEDKDVVSAQMTDTAPDYPMVVLIDSYTASAGEILSGALRNHGRAVLIGATTFGKGSVQSLLPLPDDGAMRLTVQQYLLPGDISIQAVGVTPDISFQAMVVDQEDLAISPRARGFSEASLDAHLVRMTHVERGDREGVKVLQYYLPPSQRQADLDAFRTCSVSDSTERITSRERFELDFAQQLLARTKGVATPELLHDADRLIQDISRKEEAKLHRAFKRYNVDWKVPSHLAPALDDKTVAVDDMVASVDVSGDFVPSGTVWLKVKVTNSSDSTVYRLRGHTKSDNIYFDDLDIAIGTIRPKETRRWTSKIELPPVLASRTDGVDVSFFSFSGVVPKPVSFDVSVSGRRAPVFEYRWRLEDQGNGNGVLEAQETFVFHVEAVNVGKRKSHKLQFSLSSKSGLDIESGRFVSSGLAPGESETGRFVIKVPEQPVSDNVVLTLSAEEWVPSKFPALVGLQSVEIPLAVATPDAEKPVAYLQPRVTRIPDLKIDGALGRGVSVSDAVYSLTGQVSHADGIRDIILFNDDKKIAYQLVNDNRDSVDFSFDVQLEEGMNRLVVVARKNDHIVARQSIYVRRTR